MTTRQSVAASQRNSNFKVQSTVVSGRKALVVKLDWTTAPVVKTTIRRDFKLSILAMDTQKWTPIQRGMMLLKAGQTVHFTQSAEHAGYYYVTIVGESCTCTAGLYKQQCHHQQDAASFEACRRMEEKEIEEAANYTFRQPVDPNPVRRYFTTAEIAAGLPEQVAAQRKAAVA